MPALPDDNLFLDFGEKSLHRILASMMDTIENSKSQIFDVYDAANAEIEATGKQLEETTQETQKIIAEVDALEVKEQKRKQQLARVSSNFEDYDENKIREVYDSVRDVQVKLGISREREQQLRRQRNRLELRLRRLQQTVVAAERLAMRISSMLNYLTSQMGVIITQLEEASKNKFLSETMILAQEEERLRVSREIHDGPAQDVANLLLESAICERLVDRGTTDEAKEGIQELRRHLRDCLKNIRQIIFDMRPMSLDDLGLTAALSQVIDKLKERGALEVAFQVDGSEFELPDYVKAAMFRIGQEALNNVVRHSGVKQATFRLSYSKTQVSMLISDEGHGFDPDTPTSRHEDEDDPQSPVHVSFGLLGMRERAAIIGATLNLMSKPGKGTKVHVRLPIKAS